MPSGSASVTSSVDIVQRIINMPVTQTRVRYDSATLRFTPDGDTMLIATDAFGAATPPVVAEVGTSLIYRTSDRGKTFGAPIQTLTMDTILSSQTLYWHESFNFIYFDYVHIYDIKLAETIIPKFTSVVIAADVSTKEGV